MVRRVISSRSAKQTFTTTFIIEAEFVSCRLLYMMYG
jgi:hypothetical protein